MNKKVYKYFFKNMGEMLSSGTPLLKALEKCGSESILKERKAEWDSVINYLSKGLDFTDSLRKSTSIPEFFLDQISKAEKIGDLDEVMESLAKESDDSFNLMSELDLFGNVLSLSDREIQILLRELEMDELANVILITNNDRLSDKFRQNMSERAVGLLEERIAEIDKYPFVAEKVDYLLSKFERKVNKLFPGILDEREEDVIMIVNRIIKDAVEGNASDIHIIPTLEGVYLKFRVDGILVNKKPFEKSLFAAVISRIKQMSCLDIAEKRLPQDGRVKIRVNDETLDIRISLVPHVLGEKVTMRIMRTQRAVVELRDMAFSTEVLESIYKMLEKPWGLIFVTGSTGSGKTTTCYGMLNEYLKRNLGVVSVEDPVEYVLDGATHIQVRPNIGLTFPAAIKSALRTDPDVIFIGELRDDESLKLAVRAAQCGHVVICQTHSEDVNGIIDTLSKFEGFDRAVLANALIGVVSQKLLRKLCDNCKTKEKKGFVSSGCDKCLNSGYRGRIPCNNVFEADHDFKIAFSEGDLKKARKMIKRTLMDHAEELVNQGLTSKDEIFRVFGISR